jgi:dipeptidyl aminopeptidase/acylaminoacyl peptidase
MRALVLGAVLIGLIPPAQAEPVRDHDIVPEDYFDIATIYYAVVSPDGQRVAYVESRWGEGKEGRKNDLWVVELKSKTTRRLTFDGFGVGRPLWSPDGHWIYFRGRDPHGNVDDPPYDGSRQIWRISPAGGEPFPVTRLEDGVGLFDLGRDGRTLVYTTSEEVYEDAWRDLRKKYSDLEYGHGVADLNAVWKLDLQSWRSEQILPAEQVIHQLALAPDQKRLALITADDEELIFHEGWSRIEVLDLASGELTRVTSQEWRQDHPSPFGWLEGLAWSRDSQVLAFTIDYDGYPPRVYVADWEQGDGALRRIELPAAVMFHGGLTWRGDDRTLCFRGEARARIRLHAIRDIAKGKQGKASVLTPGDVVVGAYGFDDKGKHLVAAFGTTTHLGDLFLIDKKGRGKRLTDVNPQVARWRLPQIQHIGWQGGDADSVFGILELPPGYEPGDGPLPLIVELHGGPSSSTKYRLRLWIYGRALMPAKGYALFSPNYHGSNGYGDDFQTVLIGRENDIEVTDILTGIDHLVDLGVADPERIGVTGWSNGGYLTNCVLTAAPERFRAASSGAGVLDMAMQWSVEDTPGHVVNFMQGLPWENVEAYIKGSPLYNLDRVRTPTLIHVGGSDPRVPPAHSRALYRALHHYLKVPVELIVYPGEPHGLTTHENRLAKMKWDLAWFDKYLLEIDGNNGD